MPYKEKPIVKYRWTITEVAELAKLPAHSIRFYEKHFDWLIPLYKTYQNRKAMPGYARRDYTLDGVNNVLEVVYLLSCGLSIRGIKKAYEDDYLDDLLEFFNYLRYDPESWTEKNKKEHDKNRDSRGYSKVL